MKINNGTEKFYNIAVQTILACCISLLEPRILDCMFPGVSPDISSARYREHDEG
jgi:hypothetical protein